MAEGDARRFGRFRAVDTFEQGWSSESYLAAAVGPSGASGDEPAAYVRWLLAEHIAERNAFLRQAASLLTR